MLRLFLFWGGAESLYSMYLVKARKMSVVKRYVRRFLIVSHFGLGGRWVWVMDFGFWGPGLD